MTTSQAIIDKFGGVRPMARSLGVPISTVQGWQRSGHIPARRQQFILDKAKETGIRLRPVDFFNGAAA